eukprot:scaffold12088_cov98-Isochrysis_galbana.AAC.3
MFSRTRSDTTTCPLAAACSLYAARRAGTVCSPAYAWRNSSSALGLRGAAFIPRGNRCGPGVGRDEKKH